MTFDEEKFPAAKHIREMVHDISSDSDCTSGDSDEKYNDGEFELSTDEEMEYDDKDESSV